LIPTYANKSVTQGSTRILIYIDGLFQSHQTSPSCYLTFFHIPERSICIVKRLAGSPKGAEIDPNLPHANKSVTQGSTRILIYMDGLSIKLCPSRCYLTFFHSRTFNCTSKTTGWFTKGAEIDPNLPHANKVLPKVAHAFLYTWMDFFNRTNCAQAVAILPSSIFPNVQLH
jgi:hypothetical protein